MEEAMNRISPRRLSPSPGNPGEGRGEGFWRRALAVEAVTILSVCSANPHPASPGLPGEGPDAEWSVVHLSRSLQLSQSTGELAMHV